MNNRDTSPSLFFKERGTEGVSSSRVALGDRGGEFFGGSARVRDARYWHPYFFPVEKKFGLYVTIT